jgi:uncharacterized protein (TIGR02599 family)
MVELLISLALLLVLLLMLVQVVDQTQRIWSQSTARTTEFQGARSAFEAMTRRLGQATLNTYWRAHDAAPTGTTPNFRFRRQSELQFISGPATRFFTTSPQLPFLSASPALSYPTDAVFFQAPLGYTEELAPGATTLKFRNLDSMLTGCGYFIEYGAEPVRPTFLDGLVPQRYRFRLMEMNVPAEQLTIFDRLTDTKGLNDPRVYDEKGNYYGGMVDANRNPIASWTRPFWMTAAFARVSALNGAPGGHFQYASVRAENIAAMIILPKLSEKDRVSTGNQPDPNALELAPAYQFDSWRVLNGGSTSIPFNGTTVMVDNAARDNLLPPIVQVTLVAVDEGSMARFGASATQIPNWTQNLFQAVTTVQQYTADMQTLTTLLQNQKVSYRVFTADVVLRGSKWSRDPTF